MTTNVMHRVLNIFWWVKNTAGDRRNTAEDAIDFFLVSQSQNISYNVVCHSTYVLHRRVEYQWISSKPAQVHAPPAVSEQLSKPEFCPGHLFHLRLQASAHCWSDFFQLPILRPAVGTLLQEKQQILYLVLSGILCAFYPVASDHKALGQH